MTTTKEAGVELQENIQHHIDMDNVGDTHLAYKLSDETFGNTWCDENLLHEDEDTCLLGDGFHSMTTTITPRYSVHPRMAIFLFLFVPLMGCNYYFIGSIYLSAFIILVQSVLLVLGCCCHGKLKWQRRKLSPLDDDSRYVFYARRRHNGFTHMFRATENHEMVPSWMMVLVCPLLICFEIVTLLIQFQWGEPFGNPPVAVAGYHLCSGYEHNPDDLLNPAYPELLTGGCFVDNHVSSLCAFGLLACVAAALANFYDISAQGKKSVALARTRISSLFETDPFEKDYYRKIEHVRRNIIDKPFSNGAKLQTLIIMTWPLHIFWAEPTLLFKVEGGTYQFAVWSLFAFVLLVGALLGLFFSGTMIHVNRMYKQLWWVMKLLGSPLRVESMDDLREWMEIRKWYMNYHMPAVSKLANGVVVAYAMIVFAAGMRIVFTVYYLSYTPHWTTVVGGLIIVVFGLNLLAILALCANISDSSSHIRMLEQEKMRILWRLRAGKMENAQEFVDEIDAICEHIVAHDKRPRVVGIPMTWTLYFAIMGYGATGMASVVGGLLFG